MRTTNELSECRVCDRVSASKTYLDIVAMPIGAKVRTLFIYICKGCPKADVAAFCIRGRCCLWWGGGRFTRRGLADQGPGSEGVYQLGRQRKYVVSVGHLYGGLNKSRGDSDHPCTATSNRTESRTEIQLFIDPVQRGPFYHNHHVRFRFCESSHQ